jgi:hypothetical protein
VGGGEVVAVNPWKIDAWFEQWRPDKRVKLVGIGEAMSAYERMKAERDALQARVEELEGGRRYVGGPGVITLVYESTGGKAYRAFIGGLVEEGEAPTDAAIRDTSIRNVHLRHGMDDLREMFESDLGNDSWVWEDD